jgi:hypothetical protein
MLKYFILFFLFFLFSFDVVCVPEHAQDEADYEILDLNDDYGC